MKNFYVPYSGPKPAVVSINGHKLVILAQEADALKNDLALVGGDRLKRIEAGESPEEERVVLDRLAKSVQGGVVIAPAEVGVGDVIRNLEAELPWIQ